MNNSWVLITGGSRGLGAHLVRSFWNAGWNVASVARDRRTIMSVLETLARRPNQIAIPFECDLSCPSSVEILVSQVSDELPCLDALINNAAIHGPIGPFIDSNLTHWNEAVQVNLLSPVTLCHGLMHLISKSSNGSIINLSGGGATAPRSNFSAYASAKTALVRFSETLAQELMTQNIRVNCIAPGVMNTNLLQEVISLGADISGKHEVEVAEKIISNGGVSLDKVAELALFLASNSSMGITGKLISAPWDNWQKWTSHLNELSMSDAYTLRRIVGRDRGMDWGDI